MAMASSGTKIVPESPNKLMGGLNLSILPSDCEGGAYEASPSASKAGQPQSSSDSLLLRTAGGVTEVSLGSIDLNSDSSPSSTSPYKSKLPMVLEESESLSHRDGDISSSSLSSINSSSASSILAFLHRDGVRKLKKPRNPCKKRDSKEMSLVSLLLWPLKKVRDGYMRCIMGLDRAGDLSGLVQGSTFSTSSKYFADSPVSKTVSRTYG